MNGPVWAEMVKTQVGGDELPWGPRIERDCGSEQRLECVRCSVLGDDERQRASDDVGVLVELWSEHGDTKWTCSMVEREKERKEKEKETLNVEQNALIKRSAVRSQPRLE